MKKALLLLFGVIVGLPAISQTSTQQLAEVIKVWKTKRINVQDGFVYRYKLWDGADTAIYYQTGVDTFEVTTTFKKITSTKPPIVLPDIISTLDDNSVSPAQAYSPATNAGNNVYITTGWSHMIGQPWNQNPDGTPIHYNKSFSFVDKVDGAYLEVTCSPCYKIEWWAEKRENHGIAVITLDGAVIGDIDQYSSGTTNNSTLLYTTPSMTNATHKLRIGYSGRKHPSASQTNIGHDKFVIYQKQ